MKTFLRLSLNFILNFEDISKIEFEFHSKSARDARRLCMVGFHNFNLRCFNLRVSNPNKLIVDVFLTRCRISMCQSLGPKNTMKFRKSTVSYLGLGLLDSAHKQLTSQRRHAAILYYTILYYTILYYTILYYTILYYTMTFRKSIVFSFYENSYYIE